MYQERFEELKHSGKLPSPSGVGMRILVLTRSDDFTIDDVVEAIQTDPALTGRLLKLATSAAAGGASNITTTREAAIRVGIRAVTNLALGFTLISGNRAGKCQPFGYDHYWTLSLATAVASQALAAELKVGIPEDAFTLGLLISIGELALASVHPTNYGEILLEKAASQDLDLIQLEQERLFIDHRSVSAGLLEEWGLPAHFSEAALAFDGKTVGSEFEHEETEALLRIVNAARQMGEVCAAGENQQLRAWPRLRKTIEGMGIPLDRACELFDQVAERANDWSEILNVPTRPTPTSKELERRTAPVKKSDGTSSSKKLRVLAVDDDPVSLRLLVALLKRDGHEVLTARDGKEALAVYLEHGAQMVITDWMMPEMDGLMLCRQLRKTQEGRKLYILILTGRAEGERIVEAFDAGVDDYIVKPFKPALLRARIKPALRVIQLQEDNDKQVSEKERLNKQLDIEKRKFEAAAMTDALTGLPNRRYAMSRLEKQWSNSQRANTVFSVFMLDIDFFKRVNDTWGHDVGDAVLRSTARVIQKVLRRGDTCARIGGEEFLVICPSTDTAVGAMGLGDRIREAIEQNVIRSGEYEGNVTVSVGIGILSAETHTIDALLKMSDEAVYLAKNGGRNRVMMGTPPDSGLRSA